jgi:hypothetical protein
LGHVLRRDQAGQNASQAGQKVGSDFPRLVILDQPLIRSGLPIVI